MYDIFYILIFAFSFFVSLGAQIFVSRAYSKWSKVRNEKGINGAEAGKVLAEAVNLGEIKFSSTAGVLTDHYDPRTNTVSLSSAVAGGDSIASVAIVAHELGHAEQYKERSLAIKMRQILVPAVMVSPKIAYALIMASIAFQLTALFNLAILFYSLIVFFSLLTIPVEFGASKIALENIKRSNILNGKEMGGAESVLRAAGLTYVAAGLTSLLNLLYYLTIARGRK